MSEGELPGIERRRRHWPEIPEPVPGRIAVVGICAAGKTTLVEGLRQHGYDARQSGQEHSWVPDMWRRLSRPEVLVYLDASAQTVRGRRAFDYPESRYRRQVEHLAHARAHCDLYVNTDPLTPDEVLARVLAYLRQRAPA